MPSQPALDAWKGVAIALLLAISIAAGWQVWRATNEIIDVSPVAPPQAAATVTAPVRERPDGSDRPLVASAKAHDELLLRPLFSPDRRPPRPAVTPVVVERPVPPPRPPELPEGLKLLGIVSDADRGRMALVVTKEAGGSRWMRVGDTLEEWRLAEIASDYIVLEAGTRRSKLELYPSEKPARDN